MHERVFGRAGGVEGALGVHGDVGVQRRVLLLDALEGGAEQFDGGQRRGGDQPRQLSVPARGAGPTSSKCAGLGAGLPGAVRCR